MYPEKRGHIYGFFKRKNQVLVHAVKRNTARLPEDFLFQLTPEEAAGLRSQIVISKPARGGRRYPLTRSPNTALSWRRLSLTGRAPLP